MNKLKLFTLFGLVAISILTLNAVSAYNHATFQLSDSITYNEDIIGEDRGFSLRRTADVSRKTIHGYYDWSYRPKDVFYPDQNSYRISDRLALEGFRTFQQDSRDQSKIDLEIERNRNRYFGYGGYRSYGYGGYYGGYGGYGYGGYGGYRSYYGYRY